MMHNIALQQRKIARIVKLQQRLAESSKKYSLARLGIFLVGLVCVFTIYWQHAELAVWCGLAFLIIFNIVAFFHRKIAAGGKRCQIWLQLAQDHLARLQIDWPNIPLKSSTLINPSHPFDKDLNITGQFSLLQFLDITISTQGRQRLQQWLLTTQPDMAAISHRQKLVQELWHFPFIDRLRLNFMQVDKSELDGERVADWLSQTQSPEKLRLQLFGALLLWGVFFALVFADVANLLPAYWGYAVAAYLAYTGLQRNVWKNLSEDAQFLDMEFKQSMAIFRFLEKYSYHNQPHLADLCRAFIGKSRPAQKMRTMNFIAIAIGLRMNYLIWIVFNMLLPWDFLCAFWLNHEKRKLADGFQQWLDTCYELEALCSLANLRRIDAHASLPHIANAQEIQAVQLGHPFLPPANRVYNDFHIPATGSVDLITGSNMSGKSTFLRTIGINMVLALAGGYVIASAFSAPLCRIFACIQVDDSLTGGLSQFYAEVKRLKALQDALFADDELPLFFLIDEIYKGTNNRERLIGGRAFIRQLLHQHGSGIVTTHDLELTNLAKDDAGFRNFHFREFIENNKLAFDYKLKIGPCPTTNALKIMQLEGLPIDGAA